MKIRCLYFVLPAFIFLYGCVDPQRFTSLENRVASIEMENNRELVKHKQKADTANSKIQENLQRLESRLEKDAGIGKEEYAELKDDIKTLKEELRRIQGLIEETNFKFEEKSRNNYKELTQQLEQIDQAVSKNYEKIIALEKYMGFEPSGGKKPEPDQEGAQDAQKDPEQSLYDQAKKLFDDGDRENARIQFENFINKYPDSDNADNARFWIADSFYAEKWFEKAILEYQKVLEDYPDSNKAAAARLKQGYAFAELGEKANARLILKELLKKHPGTNEALYAEKKLKTLE